MTTSYSNRPPSITSVVSSSFDKAVYSTYEKVKAERDAFKESENVYKLRCENLEVETNDLLKSYQNIYAENKVLRSKIQHGPDAQRIRRFKDEIKRLEDKALSVTANNSLLKEEAEALNKHLKQATDDKKKIEDTFKIERNLHQDKNSSLEKENKILEEKIEHLTKQQHEYQHRVRNFEDESEGLISRYKQLKRDNLKMETKFKKQKDQIEEEVNETKTLNKEMAKELIQVKMKFSKVQSELTSSKLDVSAAEKQIDYLTKELEVYKYQESQLKKNVKSSANERNRMEDELKSVENLLEETRNYGFEAVFQERKILKRKEEKHLKRIENLEMQIEELFNENAVLEKEANEYRGNMEALALANQNMLYGEAALKRRIEILENENIELDKAGQFMLAKSKKGLVVTMGNDNAKNINKEKEAFLSKLRYVEGENSRLERRIRELEHGVGFDDFDEKITLNTVRSKKKTDRLIRAEMPSLATMQKQSAYRRTLKTSRSLPAYES